jgi:hypothetical protein
MRFLGRKWQKKKAAAAKANRMSGFALPYLQLRLQ